MRRLRLAYACEGYADVRMLEAFADLADLSLLIPGRDYDASGLAGRVAAAGVRLEVIRLPSRRILAVPAILYELLRRRRDVDVVISLDARGGALAAGIACRLTGRPHLVQVLTDPVAYWRCRRFSPLGGVLARPLGAALLAGLLWAGAKLATACFGMGTYYREVLGSAEGKYREINLYGLNPANYAAPAGAADRPALREALGLPRDPPLLFYASRIAPEKDTGTLLEACRLLSREGLSFTLLNASGQHARFAAMARESGLERHAVSRDAAHPVEELPGLYRASDLCIQASKAEGFGWSPREALACGVPVIVAEVGGMRGDFEGMGLGYPPGDARALADRIRQALADPARMQAMALRGRAYVLERYGRGKALGDLTALLEEVCREG